jgi:hypothetical protein
MNKFLMMNTVDGVWNDTQKQIVQAAFEKVNFNNVKKDCQRLCIVLLLEDVLWQVYFDVSKSINAGNAIDLSPFLVTNKNPNANRPEYIVIDDLAS